MSVYVETIGTDCQPVLNVVGIRAATATVECQMVGGMLGEAPVADEYCRQPIVARVGADRQDGTILGPKERAPQSAVHCSRLTPAVAYPFRNNVLRIDNAICLKNASVRFT
jgi:hypothetical protein